MNLNRLLLIAISGLLLAGCANNRVSDQTDSAAHLTVEPRPEVEKVNPLSIPMIVKPKTVNPPPINSPQEKLYSITAFDTSVKDILFNLAQNSKHELDIWKGVEGSLTINAVKQRLPDILDRVASQLDLNISIQDNVIVVKPDLPYWRHYRVDYVNIKRSRQDSIVMNMTVGGSVSPVAGGESTGSRSVVEVSSEHDFWNTLRVTLLSITGETRNSNRNETSSSQSASMITPNTPSSVSDVMNNEGSQSSSSSNTTASNSAVPVQSNNVVVNPEAGLVMVLANAKTQRIIGEYLDDITQRTERQVMIEASVVEVTLSDKHQSGIDWSNTGFKNLSNRTAMLAQPGAAPLSDNLFTAKLGGDVGLDLNVGLKMLEEFGDVKVLSSPKIMAVNNQSALLKVVDNQVYFTVNVSRSTSTAGTDVTYSTTVHTVPVGFMMSMTPFVNDNREVSINIRPTISRIIANVIDPNPDLKQVGVESLVPVVQEREMETVLRLRDMQTAVIGGLIEDRTEQKDAGISWLSRIPLIGNSLFGYTESSVSKIELVIFIRPVIVDRPDIEQGDLQHYRSFLKAKTGVSE